MKRWLRPIVYGCVMMLVVGGSGAIGFLNTMDGLMAVQGTPWPQAAERIVPEYDPDKPTVAVMLANDSTEVFDFLYPYEMFARTESFNVYAVAPDREAKALTGGLDIVPHYAYDELDAMLGISPDIIVIPFMPVLHEERYAPTREWIRKHGDTDTTLLTICTGAENLADTGLLAGKAAATHWGDIGRLEKAYPETRWIRDVRYVHDGNVVSSAGLTSGIDATLYVITQKLGEPAARKVAEELHYPSYAYVEHPEMTPYRIEVGDAVYMLNQAFQWNKVRAGVLLYDGIDEGALASVFDTYAASGTTTMYTVSIDAQPIVTRFGLLAVARYRMSESVPAVDRLIVAGVRADVDAKREVQAWEAAGGSAEPFYLHQGSETRFLFDAALEDLARQEDVRTAAFAAKRLEYRGTGLNLAGAPISYEAFGLPVLLALVTLVIVYILGRIIVKRN